MSVFELLTPLLRRWRTVARIPATLAVLAAASVLIMPPKFKARASFRAVAGPEIAASLGGLASLAGQLGVAGISAPGNSPDFYAEVLESRELLEQTERD